jgi:hypothetical protein
MISPHPGVHTGRLDVSSSTDRPRRWSQSNVNLIEDSNTHPSVMIRYSTFLLDSFFPARFSNSRVTGHLT